jgi:glycogen debranching enzyme
MKSAALLLLLIPVARPGRDLPALERLGFRVGGESREVAYTNKVSASYYTETHAPHRSSWQGFTVAGEEMLEDYTILLGDSTLDRGRALSVTVSPDHLERRYEGGIVERVFLTDSLSALCVEIAAPRPVTVSVLPWLAGTRGAEGLSVKPFDRAAVIGIRGLSDRRSNPLSLAVGGPTCLPVVRQTNAGTLTSPVVLVSARGKHHRFVFAAAREPAEGLRLVRELDATRELARRAERMERLLRATEVRSADTLYARSLGWAILSLDALIMNQRDVGIFAGLPWFNNYWGRDTFIALPGATLVTGRFELAAAILRSFAAHQELDRSSPNEGRIPNFVSLNDVAYNTADGTPRFVMMAREYVERSGDELFAAEIYPTVVRSIEGTLRHRVDSLGFLTHGDAETWMDAVGPAGPWSPRGDRANDIQALWEKQLSAGIWFATRFADARSAREWETIRRTLRASFARHFPKDLRLADRLRADGTPDFTLRPNQIFAADMVGDSLRGSILATVVSELTYPYGVASLSQDDPNFHPYHQNPPYYPKDAAYHNGTVWTWVQGAVISELCRANRSDLAFQVTANTARQILDRGAVGTQSELLDALPRPGRPEPEMSGTFSQAWNLAEYVRNFYDDYLGVRASLLDRTLVFRPRLPDALLPLTARIPAGRGAILLTAEKTGEGYRYTLQSDRQRDTLRASVSLDAGNGQEIRARWPLGPGATVTLLQSGRSLTPHPVPPGFVAETVPASLVPLPEGLALAQPRLRADLPSLRGPDYPAIPHGVVISSDKAAGLFCRASDPAGDDTGTVAGSRYTYPRNRAFARGGFDLRELEIRVDSLNAYFTVRLSALANPGWHPEYGFQLTYLALAIDWDGAPGTGQRHIGHNSGWTLDGNRGYERLILVGGGVQVLDSSGTIRAGYVPLPPDAARPIGDAPGGAIRFAIPRGYLGTPDPRWRITLLAGGQDDHGGAGIGEFRTVNAEASEWNGGGRKGPDDPNVYDALIARPGQ